MTNDEKFKRMVEMIEAGATEDEQTKMLTGYTKTELNAAFELIRNKMDTKGRIDSYCTVEEMPIMTAAVEFFTATTPNFTNIGFSNAFGRFKAGQEIVRITALGYRMGPAGDH